MKAAIILTFDISPATVQEDMEVIADILKKIDPPSLPKFDGEVRVTAGQPVNMILQYLDEP